MKSVWQWIVAYLARWLPAATETGLFPVGDPGPESPVIVTANFWLTVHRVRKALRGANLWLLVANTNGINVWCAAAGGLFTHNRVVDAVTVSRLATKVSHRRLVLPALAAPGVDADAVRSATGFAVVFGPVHATDLREYLRTNVKTEAMRRFRFTVRHRLDMFIPMNLPVYLIVAVVLAAVRPSLLPGFSALFWGAVVFLYIFLNVIPGRTGWAQATVSAVLWAIAWAARDWFTLGKPLAHWGWLVALLGVFLLAGIDLAGTASPRKSDFEILLGRFGTHGLGSLVTQRDVGTVTLLPDRCIGCGRCADICPIGVFGPPNGQGNTTFRDREACFSCGACVRQCPVGALAIGPEAH